MEKVEKGMKKRVIGIDIGGSTTKIVGLYDNQIFSPLLVKATDPVASMYGAFGKFISMNKLSLHDIDRIMVTGVGASFLTEKLYGIATGRVEEFTATGKGGLFSSGLSKAIIVSMGTGTAFVMADENSVNYIGGTGVGGGTLLGLSNRMLNIRGFEDLIEIARNGNLRNVDLAIGDITRDQVASFSPETTASNFGKISDSASKADIALGIINLVFQTIGMLSVFASRMNHIKDIVLTGNLVNVPQAKDILGNVEKFYDIRFHFPTNGEFATAIGAAIVGMEGKPFTEIP
ncbi:MAG: type II pantothenate kinase [Clostridia bacterium]|jgi:type II pantothenate kinase